MNHRLCQLGSNNKVDGFRNAKRHETGACSQRSAGTEDGRSSKTDGPGNYQNMSVIPFVGIGTSSENRFRYGKAQGEQTKAVAIACPVEWVMER